MAEERRLFDESARPNTRNEHDYWRRVMNAVVPQVVEQIGKAIMGMRNPSHLRFTGVDGRGRWWPPKHKRKLHQGVDIKE
jgi:hypothetical protein